MKFVLDFIMLLLVSSSVAFPIRNLYEKWKKEMDAEDVENSK